MIGFVLYKFFFFEQKTAYEIRLSLMGSEMGIRNRDEGMGINSKCNNKSNATNVLAFIGDIEQEKEVGLSPPFLGDIVVCLAVVEKADSALYISVSSHFIHMVVRGFLHLLGYDHFSDEE